MVLTKKNKKTRRMVLKKKNKKKLSKGGVHLRGHVTGFGQLSYLDINNPHARPISDIVWLNKLADQYILAGYNRIPNHAIPQPPFGQDIYPLVVGSFTGTNADKDAVNALIDEKLNAMANEWKAPSGKQYKKTRRHFKKLQEEAIAPPHGIEYKEAKKRFKAAAKKQKRSKSRSNSRSKSRSNSR